MTEREDVAELRDQVGDLLDQVAALLDRVRELEGRSGATDPVPSAARSTTESARLVAVPGGPGAGDIPAGGPTADHPAGSSRRQLLRAVGVAAAGAVGGTVVLAGATAGPAAAADGATVKVGESHTGSGSTSVTRLNNTSFQSYGGPTSAILGVHEGIGIDAISGYAQGANGDGVRGYASDTGAGVSAESMKGHGVLAKSTGAGKAGVSAEATAAGGIGVLAKSSSGPGIQVLAGPSMPPFTGTWAAGSLVMNNGQLWYCWKDGVGEASKWCRLSSTFTALAGSKRVYDSRPDTQPLVGTKTRFEDHTTRAIDAKTGGAIIPGASAVLLNVVATNTNAAGYFSIWRNGISWPGTSSINWNRPDTTIANSVVTSLDPNGFFQARMEGAGGAHLVVDVVGFYL